MSLILILYWVKGGDIRKATGEALNAGKEKIMFKSVTF